MQATNFEYDGTVLSDYGYVICQFNSAGGVETNSIGSIINFNKVSTNNGKFFALASSKYEECISIEFDICKDPNAIDDTSISDSEVRALIKWLNRRDFHKLRFFDSCNSEEYGCHYNASFNVSKIAVDGTTYGLRLKAETDSPFAYGDEYVIKERVNKNDYIVARNVSDEIGTVFPNIKITCRESGDMLIRNDKTGRSMLIKNCSAGEEIDIDCRMQVITSSLSGHDVANDFNYRFLYIVNDRYDNENDLYVSLDCDIEIRYYPFVKIVP